ncbi:MAG: addiction module protein [Candidatus Schekmanbacteria bacterium]|nr:addiction module protein [Candidatus Schekmanbacteria bacterium]
MNKTVKTIIEQALQISPEERAVIIEKLISSLDAGTDLDVEVAWQNEVQKRIAQIDKKDVACIPWEVVQQRLRGTGIVNG